MHFIIELAQGNSHQFCLASVFALDVLCIFPLSYKGNSLSVKLLIKVTMSIHFVL